MLTLRQSYTHNQAPYLENLERLAYKRLKSVLITKKLCLKRFLQYIKKNNYHTQSWYFVSVCMHAVGGDLRRDRHEIRLGMFPSLSIKVQDSRSPGSPTKYNSFKRVTLAYVKTEPSYIIKGHNESKYLVYLHHN